MTTTATITVVHFATVEVDVDALVSEVGPKARSKAYLKDYALGQLIEGVYHSEVESIIIDTEKEEKPKLGIGSY